MANLPKDMAEDAGKARSAGGGNYIQHGDLILMIKKWFYQKIQDRCIITEFLVVDSKKKTVYEGAKAVEQEPNAVGSECSETVNYDGPGKLSAPSNARAVVLGLFGFKEGEVPDQKVSETLSYVCEDKQPAAGMLIAVSTFAKEKRQTRGEFITGRNWICVARPGDGANAPDKVAARLAAVARSPEECVKLALEHLKAGPGVKFAEADKPSAAPAIPQVPQVPGIPSAPPVDPLAGWTVHPDNASFYFKDGVVKSKVDILAAAGR